MLAKLPVQFISINFNNYLITTHEGFIVKFQTEG